MFYVNPKGESDTVPSRTIVLQACSLDEQKSPEWVWTAMDTVEKWARGLGFDYSWKGDPFLLHCPEDVRRHCKDRIYPVVDIARLEWLQEKLTLDKLHAIWADADILIFDPKNLSIQTEDGCAFAVEIPSEIPENNGNVKVGQWGVNNSFMVFERNCPILPFYLKAAITKIMKISPEHMRHTAVGPDIMKAIGDLFPLKPIQDIGLLTFPLLRAIVEKNTRVLESYMKKTGFPMRAANLCLSTIHYQKGNMTPEYINGVISEAINILIDTEGRVINKYVE